jgi:hypothetical protein
MPAFTSLAENQKPGLRFAVSFTEEMSPKPLDGRVLLMISNNDKGEPRFQVSEFQFVSSQLVFGIDVDSLKPGEKALVDHTVFGFPLESIAKIPAGDYRVQAVLHRYETFHRADGHVVKLPMDRGEGQMWKRAPGNLYSEPLKVSLDPLKDEEINIVLDKKIGPVTKPKDTKYIKHIRIKSERLTKFWGRPMHLGAAILLPEGFDTHPDVRYPLAIRHGHFTPTFLGFSPKPPPDNMPERRKARAQSAYDFYKQWTGKNYPRFIVAVVQHPCPYYDDSYGVNSANVGPYGDAITYELIPYIEKKFRGIGKGWARTLYGGSTGGWTALAMQVFYPDEYNGCWAACPDTVDFRSHILVNIYEDKNAYYIKGPWIKYAIPGGRNYQGQVFSTNVAQNHRELAMATKSRSGFQWDAWQAVFSPVGDDGYPKPIWDKLTGDIDKSVAEYWRENYDISYILQRDWCKIGTKLKKKIHIYTGDMDTFYLNNPVYLLEEFLESTTDPYYDGEIIYGDRFEHCWCGHPEHYKTPRTLSYEQFYLPKMEKHIIDTAPPGADVKSRRY